MILGWFILSQVLLIVLAGGSFEAKQNVCPFLDPYNVSFINNFREPALKDLYQRLSESMVEFKASLDTLHQVHTISTLMNTACHNYQLERWELLRLTMLLDSIIKFQRLQYMSALKFFNMSRDPRYRGNSMRNPLASEEMQDALHVLNVLRSNLTELIQTQRKMMPLDNKLSESFFSY